MPLQSGTAHFQGVKFGLCLRLCFADAEKLPINPVYRLGVGIRTPLVLHDAVVKVAYLTGNRLLKLPEATA